MGNCLNPNMGSSRNRSVQGGNHLNRRNSQQVRQIQEEENYTYVPRPLNPNPTNAILRNTTGTNLLSRYEIGAELGQGYFGTAYMCTDRITGQTYACKSIPKEKLRTQVQKANMQREVEIMGRLPSHPNLTELHATYEDNRSIHLIMELCEGGDLGQRIATNGYYSEISAGILAKDILRAIQVCHQNGIMHRDVKLNNFLFVNEGETATLKLSDFGLSVPFVPGQKFNDPVSSPLYAAPEVYLRCHSQESDIWSAGVMIYVLLSGQPPFWAEGGGPKELAKATINQALKFEGQPWPAISQNAKIFVRGLLRRDIRKRLTAEQALEHPWLRGCTRMHQDGLYVHQTATGR